MMITLETTEDIFTEKEKKQNVFNVVWKHSLGMTGPSWQIAGNPRYKLREGDKAKGKIVNSCFIGCTIPVSVYRADMETNTIRALFAYDDYPQLDEHYVKKHYSRSLSFLMRLQDIHDSHFKDRQKWLKLLATEYELTIPA